MRTLHTACIKFPDVSTTVVPLLMEFLSDTNELAAMDVLIFVREAMSRCGELIIHTSFVATVFINVMSTNFQV